VARSRDQCCHEIAAMRSLFTVDLHAAVNSIQPFNVTMETKTGFPSYKIIRTAINSIHVRRFSCNVTDIFVDFNEI
jgi:hypothetical protein